MIRFLFVGKGCPELRRCHSHWKRFRYRRRTLYWASDDVGAFRPIGFQKRGCPDPDLVV